MAKTIPALSLGAGSVQFKVLVLTFKALNAMEDEYLQGDLLQIHIIYLFIICISCHNHIADFW